LMAARPSAMSCAVAQSSTRRRWGRP
jgi:hypothetical protein